MKRREKFTKTVPFQMNIYIYINICRHRRMKCAIKQFIELRRREHTAWPNRNIEKHELCFGLAISGGSVL